MAETDPMSPNSKPRCPWASTPVLIDYHDREWGVPQRSDRALFEFLILEGAQAGLSWSTVLAKRDAYRRAFSNFDPEKVARYGAPQIRRLLLDPGIVRNRLKVHAAVSNARAFLEVGKEFGSFDAYIWQFTGGRPLSKPRRSLKEVAAQTKESEKMSKDLIRRGFKFVGPTICYAFMQAVGMVNDHLISCFRYAEIERELRSKK
ncbi:MAG TPA: DNA-3-methyladenine glycosylase I [Terriglobales bacterium]